MASHVGSGTCAAVVVAGLMAVKLIAMRDDVNARHMGCDPRWQVRWTHTDAHGSARLDYGRLHSSS